MIPSGAVILCLLVGFSRAFEIRPFQATKMTLPGKMKSSSSTHAKKVTPDSGFNHDFSHFILSPGLKSGTKNVPLNKRTNDKKLLEKKIQEVTEPLEETIANLTETNKRLEVQVDSLNSAIRSLNSQKARQTGECSSASNLVKNLQANVTSLTSELQTTKKEVTSLTTELKETEEMAKKLKTEKSNLEDELKSTKKTVMSLSTKLEEKGKKVELKAETPDLASELTSTKKQVASLTTELKTTQEMVRKLKSQKQSLSGELTSTKKQMTSMSTELKGSKKAVKKLKAEKLDLEVLLDNAISKLNNPKKKKESKPDPGPQHTVSPAVDRCPEGFTNNKTADICFGLITNMEFGFDRAGRYCQETYGGRLVVLDTPKKYLAVKTALYKTRRSSSFWVGCHKHSDGRMKWVNGKLTARQIWASLQPSNGEKCATLDFRYSFKLSHERCTESNLFVCEVVLSNARQSNQMYSSKQSSVSQRTYSSNRRPSSRQSYYSNHDSSSRQSYYSNHDSSSRQPYYSNHNTRSLGSYFSKAASVSRGLMNFLGLN